MLGHVVSHAIAWAADLAAGNARQQRQQFAGNLPGMCFVSGVADCMVRQAGTVGMGGGVFVN